VTPSRKTRLTLRGTLLITAGAALGISGFLIGSPELTAISLALILLPANSWFLERLRKPVSQFDLHVRPEYVTAHSTVELFVTVIGGQIPAWKVSLELPSALGGTVKLDRGETKLHVTAHHRGVVRLGTIAAQRRDPLNLVSTVLTGVCTKKVVIYPYITALKNETVRRLWQRLSRRQLQYSLAKPTSDDATLRQYVAGDDLRRVHWTATARHGSLLVRSDEGTPKRGITLFIDNRQNPAHPARVERIISVAASGAVFFIDRGWKVNIQTIASSGRLRTYRALSTSSALNELAHTPTVATLNSGQPARPNFNEIALLTFSDADLPVLASRTSGAPSTHSPVISMVFSSQNYAESRSRYLYVEDTDTIDEAWNKLAREM